MAEEYECRGEWWLPSNPSTCLAGTLTFSQDMGAILELDGSFTREPEESELFNPPIVNGVSNTGTDITLCHCLGKRLTIYSGGRTTSKVYAHNLFVGVHFKDEDDIKFRHMIVYYSHLDGWLGISGFKTREEGKEIIIKYKEPDSIRAFISSTVALSLDFGHSYSPYMLTEATLKQSVHVTLLPVENMAFTEYKELIHQFQNFLSLATTEYVYPTFIAGLAEIDSYKKTMGNHIGYPFVNVFYQLARSPQKYAETSSPDPLFTFKAISNEFEQYLQNWFEKQELLKPVHQLYFGTLYNPAMYLDQRFMAYVQALEAYHRRTTDNFELSEEEHEERIKQILDSVSPHYKAWLRAKLEYSNEPSLRKRLKELIEANRALPSGLARDGKDLINKVCTTRNYLIHYDSKLEGEVAKGEELYNLTQKLKVLLEACFLRELGFSSKTARTLLSNRYRRFAFIQE